LKGKKGCGWLLLDYAVPQAHWLGRGKAGVVTHFPMLAWLPNTSRNSKRTKKGGRKEDCFFRAFSILGKVVRGGGLEKGGEVTIQIFPYLIRRYANRWKKRWNDCCCVSHHPQEGCPLGVLPRVRHAAPSREQIELKRKEGGGVTA